MIAVAVALLVLVLLELALGALEPPVVWVGVAAVVDVTLPAPLTAVFVVDDGEVVTVFPVPLTAALVVPGFGVALAVVVVGLLVPLLAVPCTGAVVPLAAVPEPLTVDAFTVVDPDAFTLPEPLLVPVTVVEPAASVRALVGLLDVGVLLVVRPPSTGAAVPLAATPEPLTVEALTVVDPEALTVPEPLLVALTVVEPDAFVNADWANAEPPEAMPSSTALTAAAIVLLGCWKCLTVIELLSFTSRQSFSLN